MWKFWLIVSGICLAIEAVTVGFLVFWFAVGALLALITSFITDSIIIQSAVFLISSTLLMFLTRPFINKYSSEKDSKKSNAFSIIGKEAIVTEDIDSINGKGQIKIGGEIWSAKTDNNEIIPKDSNVEIIFKEVYVMWFLIILLLIILFIAYKTIKVVKQSEVYIIERLGKFHKVADAGLTIIVPFMDRVRSVVSLKQQTMDIPPQGVITKDNVTITIDTVVFCTKFNL